MPYKLRSIILHILGIFAFLSIPVLTSPDFSSNRDMLMVSEFRKDFFSYFLLLLFFYANFYYFIPKFYFPKKLFLYFSVIFISYAIIVGLPDFFFPSGFHDMDPGPMMQPGMDDHPMPPNQMFFMPQGGSLLQFLLVLSLSFIIKINSQLTEINSEKLKAEVSYLKAQINPHFLFNTLNSLYALTIEKSDAAPDAVLKLSNMMRYVVSESSNDFVPLEKEINYIKDYVDLQRLRISDESNLEFSVKGSSKGKRIAPLVVIPFIENAFKYGINSEENWHIAIAIDLSGDDFLLDVINNQVHVHIPEEEASEQGIENTAKRLEFIYPGEHELQINDNKDNFQVHLKIKLS
ncbi:hypothetical protein FNO01nite_22160 [Flavobacterium noncentrifugens]|uniref:Histidine kinase n=1 Tax=Flavobacterium noncentrifugens TaxID=1128970 RepID=A0A1G9AS73_9FLAO|nr:sensor histidine kinase [Flavobacterium noncentrifugens]GEP51544.1 hypothetical protein FNO01nite_22160 [Flavobacterium noncentrifugens]SDK29490.1 Histidine kinase [Flavobacterium noncentrifugens]